MYTTHWDYSYHLFHQRIHDFTSFHLLTRSTSDSRRSDTSKPAASRPSSLARSGRVVNIEGCVFGDKQLIGSAENILPTTPRHRPFHHASARACRVLF
jgi:hypothetical protein